MIIYRIQTYPGTPDWTNDWYPTQAEGQAALADCTKVETPARLDKIDVPAGREGLCEFLNTANANHMNQEPSELVARNF